MLFFFLIAATHGVLDAFTNGGLGIALFSPFDTGRYFMPFRPLVVAPIGFGAMFSEWGLAVIVSEAKWVWLPLSLATLIMEKIHKKREKPRDRVKVV